jgi:hypothetical protein
VCRHAKGKALWFYTFNEGEREKAIETKRTREKEKHIEGERERRERGESNHEKRVSSYVHVFV